MPLFPFLSGRTSYEVFGPYGGIATTLVLPEAFDREKDDALAGQCMHARYDAANPPAYVNVLFHKLGRRFILEAQQLPIYETSSKYSGKVCIIQGRKDKIVPVSYAERYHQSYKDSELTIFEDEGHFLNGNKARLTDRIVTFLKENLA
jgi:pimeloyl-ACP methyl ester carboxylesterase